MPGRTAQLGERQKKLSQPVLRYPYSGIAYSKPECVLPVQFRPCDAQRYISRRSKFGRIRQQIEQALAHFGDVRMHTAGVVRHLHMKPVSILFDEGLYGRGEFAYGFSYVESFGEHLHAPRLDFRKIENIAD